MLNFTDAIKIAKGCHDFGGGYKHDSQLEIYQHGITTVVNALEAAERNGFADSQIAVLHKIGSKKSEKENIMNLKEWLKLLGFRVEDRVTGFQGVVVSITFDLYGCIQAVVNPGISPEGKLRENHWFDVSRLKITSDAPVLPQPDFMNGPHADGSHGPAERPAIVKP